MFDLIVAMIESNTFFGRTCVEADSGRSYVELVVKMLSESSLSDERMYLPRLLLDAAAAGFVCCMLAILVACSSHTCKSTYEQF